MLAGNLLSALHHMIGWMLDEEHIEPDDDPTIGLKSGKAKASRESGGWVPWTEESSVKNRCSARLKRCFEPGRSRRTCG
jgi:hypothetical protein